MLSEGYAMRAHPFSLRQLQYAVAVADAGRFRLAAERCLVSQPSLSAQLAQLEAVLGVRLFERNRQRVLFTAAGEQLVARARRLVTEADDLMLSARHLDDPLAGPLRIGVIPTVAPYLLPEVAPALRAAYPHLTVLWSEDRTGSLLRELERGRLDAALLAHVPGVAHFEQAEITGDEFVLAGPADHPLLRRRRPAQLSELTGTAVLLLEDGHCFREQALALCATAGAREADFRGTSLATLALLVAGGAGVTLLPSLALPVENRRGDLRIRRFARPAPSRVITLLWRRESAAAVGMGALATTMRNAYRKPGRLARPRRAARKSVRVTSATQPAA
jgi:LysR family hydrogen peroxide-inducible transcriptional activator